MLQAENSNQPQEAARPNARSVGFERLCNGGSGLRPETVSFQQILSEFLVDPFSVNDRYDFEHVTTYLVQPNDNLEEVIKTHVKVALDPRYEYVITNPIKIKTLCYVIGNGAKIKVACREAFGIEVYCRELSPGIVGMWAVTFQNVIFERDRARPGGVVNSRTFVLFHGCNFIGCMGTAIRLLSGGDVKGCHFFACYKGIECESKMNIKVGYCTFETCMVGIKTSGMVRISHCLGLNIYCFAYVTGSAKFIGNSIINSNRFFESGLTEMLSCHGGVILPLATVHICASDFHVYPVFRCNLLTRCKLFVGRRGGNFSPIGCSLSYSSVIVEKSAFPSVNLSYTFHQSATVWKLLRSTDPRSGEAKKCLCGELHVWPELVQMEYTRRALPNPYNFSCDSRFFSSDEDDE